MLLVECGAYRSGHFLCHVPVAVLSSLNILLRRFRTMCSHFSLLKAIDGSLRL